MIRFAIKCALGLGLLAMVLPLGREGATKDSNLDVFGLAVGFQEAVSDIGGFCERAPAACDAAREVAVFAGDRIEDGFRIGYRFVGEKLAGAPQTAADAPAPEMAKPAMPALAATASEPSLPQPYQPPKRPHPEDGRAEASVENAVAPPPKVPTPHPRG